METPPTLLDLNVGTSLYVKKEGRIMPIMPTNPSKILITRDGIPLCQGFIVEILEIKNNAARIQMYGENRQKFGTSQHWYDLEKFSSDLFGIDHRNPNAETRECMSQERATELLEGNGGIRSTDQPKKVLEIARTAHRKLTGRDETSN